MELNVVPSSSTIKDDELWHRDDDPDVLVEVMWGAWMELHWMEKERWKQKIVAQTFSKYHLCLRVWRGWMSFLEARLMKEKFNDVAILLHGRHIYRRCFGSWLTAIDICRLESKAALHWSRQVYGKHLQAWAEWAEFHSRYVISKDVAVTHWALRLMQKCILSWIDCLVEEELLVDEHRAWSSLASPFRALKRHASSQRAKRLKHLTAERHFSNKLSWKALGGLKSHLEQTMEAKTAVLVTRATVHHKVKLVVKTFRLWTAEAKRSSRKRSCLRIAKAHARVTLLSSSLVDWSQAVAEMVLERQGEKVAFRHRKAKLGTMAFVPWKQHSYNRRFEREKRLFSREHYTTTLMHRVLVTLHQKAKDGWQKELNRRKAVRHRYFFLLGTHFSCWCTGFMIFRDEKRHLRIMAAKHHILSVKRGMWKHLTKLLEKRWYKAGRNNIAWTVWAHNICQRIVDNWRVWSAKAFFQRAKVTRASDFHQNVLLSKCVASWTQFCTIQRAVKLELDHEVEGYQEQLAAGVQSRAFRGWQTLHSTKVIKRFFLARANGHCQDQRQLRGLRQLSENAEEKKASRRMKRLALCCYIRGLLVKTLTSWLKESKRLAARSSKRESARAHRISFLKRTILSGFGQYTQHRQQKKREEAEAMEMYWKGLARKGAVRWLSAATNRQRLRIQMAAEAQCEKVHKISSFVYQCAKKWRRVTLERRKLRVQIGAPTATSTLTHRPPLRDISGNTMNQPAAKKMVSEIPLSSPAARVSETIYDIPVSQRLPPRRPDYLYHHSSTSNKPSSGGYHPPHSEEDNFGPGEAERSPAAPPSYTLSIPRNNYHSVLSPTLQTPSQERDLHSHPSNSQSPAPVAAPSPSPTPIVRNRVSSMAPEDEMLVIEGRLRSMAADRQRWEEEKKELEALQRLEAEADGSVVMDEDDIDWDKVRERIDKLRHFSAQRARKHREQKLELKKLSLRIEELRQAGVAL